MLRNPDEYLPAYEIYLQRIPTNVLQCRIFGHNFPDFEKELKKLQRNVKSKIGITKTGLGSFEMELICDRHCGVSVIKYLSSDGYWERTPRRIIDEYLYPEYGYLLPEKARSGKGITGQMWAMARAEYFQRLYEKGLIKDELAD